VNHHCLGSTCLALPWFLNFLLIPEGRRPETTPPVPTKLFCLAQSYTVCNWLIPPFLNVFCPTSLRSTTGSLAIDTSIQDEVSQVYALVQCVRNITISGFALLSEIFFSVAVLPKSKHLSNWFSTSFCTLSFQMRLFYTPVCRLECPCLTTIQSYWPNQGAHYP